jgi:Sortase domain
MPAIPRLCRPVSALIAGALLAGWATAGYLESRPPRHDFGAVPAAPPPTWAVALPRGDAAEPRSPRSGTLLTKGAVPVQLQIPVVRVRARVVPVGVALGGALNIPANPSQVGWWSGGSSPGQLAGTIVMVGHVDSAVTGAGALFRLQDVRPGDRVMVRTRDRVYQYIVRALRAYSKTVLPAGAIFGQHVVARLVIVTCGGPFDAATHHYRDNIVAYAVPAGH